MMEVKIAVISAGVKFVPETFTHILKSAGYDVAFYPLDRKKGYGYIDWKSIDVVYNVGFFFNVDVLFDALKAKYPHLKIVNWWVGVDILNAASFIRARPKCRRCIFRSIDVHVVDCVDFIKELKDGLNIKKSWYVPSIPEPMPLTRLPNDFAAAVYMPPHRKAFYGYPIIIETARQLPDVPFYFFSLFNYDRDKTVPPMPNVHFVGFVQGEDKFDWWSKCSACLTIPIHGGVSLTMIEFLQMGRRAVCNKKLPHVYYVKEPLNPNMIVEKLKEIMKFKEPDEEASKFYHEEYSYDKVIEKVKPVLESLEAGED